MKAIQKELGETTDVKDEIVEIEDKLKKLKSYLKKPEK